MYKCIIIYILPENTAPHCNYKIIGKGDWRHPTPPPLSGDAPDTVKPFRSSPKFDKW